MVGLLRKFSLEGSSDSSGRVKRALDLLVLVLLFPFVLLGGLAIAAAVALDSPGPVIFRARRIGKGGEEFVMFKFRTMRFGVGGNSLASGSDVRITPVGRFLRATRLDELPQLWNVLRGQMSMVGPRPELREFVDLHEADYREILAVPPGVTGPTQLRFAGVEARLLSLHDDPVGYYREHLLPDKVALDLDYARYRSNRGDLRVICQTLLLPLILAWQGIHGGASPGRRSVALGGAVMAVAIIPVIFALGLGSPR
jgi:lipopolysaccharide/colanic/teichoic acid biosynthesis glycosyltransferase